jgi:hypothetical protein
MLFARATKDEALEEWVHLQDNDDFLVCQVVIMCGFEIAKEPVAWLCMRKDKLPTAHDQ